MYYHIWLDDYKFTYQLLDISPANNWAAMMSNTGISTLRNKLDPWHGSTLTVQSKILALNHLIAELNHWLPQPIVSKFEIANVTDSLSRLHIHFPELERTETDEGHLLQLQAYNDLIHQIDLAYRNGGKDVFLLVCPDTGQFIDLNSTEYVYFRPHIEFGDLLIHYPHVGRHPLELFSTKDVNCPTDQIICQSRISVSHTLRFYNSKFDKNVFEQFYKNSGLQWPYAVDNPQLAIGYIKIGNLIAVNDKHLSKQEILSIVNSTSVITKWQIEA